MNIFFPKSYSKIGKTTSRVHNAAFTDKEVSKMMTRTRSFVEIQKTPTRIRKERMSSMFLSVSRKDVVAAMSPPVGMYNINYRSIDRNISTPTLYKPQKKKKIAKQKIVKTEDTTPIKKRLKGVPFAKQVPRKDPPKEKTPAGYDVNYDALTSHIPSPQMDKQVPRNPLFIESKLLPSPQLSLDDKKTLKHKFVKIDHHKKLERDIGSENFEKFKKFLALRQTTSAYLRGKKEF